MKYIVFITLLTKDYAPLIAGRCVLLGWTVSPASDKKKIVTHKEGTVSSVIALEVDADTSAEDTRIAISGIMADLKASFFSIVVVAHGSCAWTSTLLEVSNKEPESSWERLEKPENPLATEVPT